MAKSVYWSQNNALWLAKLAVPAGHEMDVHHRSTGEITTHRAEQGEILLPKDSHIVAFRDPAGNDLIPAARR